jgi:ubiquinone/menaquinone biosynthesis C-methylase UbiE
VTNESVQAAYSRRAAEYIELFGSIDAAADLDRARISAWADSVDGRIIDVGCGPGQWTHWLGQLGHDVEGIDPTPAFITEARRRFPSASYRLAHAQDLGVESASLGGVLAWYSLIHTEPDKITAPLTEFARCLRPGGGLALGFFTGPERRPFDHAVATAYYWPIDTLASVLESVGFEVLTTAARKDPGVRRQGLITALRANTTT